MWHKVVKYVLVVVVVIVAGLATYAWVDTAVTLDHARQQQKAERQRSEILRQLILEFNRGAKRDEVTQLIRRKVRDDHVVKEESDRIIVGDVMFVFDANESLSNVSFFGSPKE